MKGCLSWVSVMTLLVSEILYLILLDENLHPLCFMQGSHVPKL